VAGSREGFGVQQEANYHQINWHFSYIYVVALYAIFNPQAAFFFCISLTSNYSFIKYQTDRHVILFFVFTKFDDFVDV